MRKPHKWTYNQSFNIIVSSCTILLRQSGDNALNRHISPKITFCNHLKDLPSISKCWRNNREEEEAVASFEVLCLLIRKEGCGQPLLLQQDILI